MINDLQQLIGLPIHPLLVHGVVVLAPLSALAQILTVFSSRLRRRLGVIAPLSALLVVVLMPITMLAGEELAKLTGPLPAVEKHAGFATALLPWTVALFIASAAWWSWFRWGEEKIRQERPTAATTMSVGIAVVLCVAAVGTVLFTVLTGDAGARAVWGGILG